MTLVSIQSLTEMGIINISWG